MSYQASVLFSPQCPNCVRFIDALRRTSMATAVNYLDVTRLDPQQLSRVQAVPAVVTAQGQTLYGTKAFEWLKQFEGDVELEGFGGENGALAFSDVDSLGYAMYTEGYSTFEPVP